MEDGSYEIHQATTETNAGAIPCSELAVEELLNLRLCDLAHGITR